MAEQSRNRNCLIRHTPDGESSRRRSERCRKKPKENRLENLAVDTLSEDEGLDWAEYKKREMLRISLSCS